MNTYLKSLSLPSPDEEFDWIERGGDPQLKGKLKKVYTSYYPFRFFTRFFGSVTFEFDPITVFYGSNGSGKSTLLNVISEILALKRNAPYNKTDFFDDYCGLCDLIMDEIPYGSKMITSDDIFRKMNAIRTVNSQIDTERNEIRELKSNLQLEAIRNPEFMRFKGLDSYDVWKERVDAVQNTTSAFITNRLGKNLASGSNGETAINYLTEEITDNALYLLDEPENSLAPKLQLELKQFIEDSARFFGCQFIIATHSPLLLAMKEAKIYNLDDDYADEYKWTELENVKVYADFFKEHAEEFKD
ncbi:MAG: AAA family ATPase [Clostridia bacterium]|nr:AAA family ATPase [Clostridia bacterium]